MQNLRDRIAVVTGGGSGIGRALALAFASEGMHVAVADIDGDSAARVAEEIRGAGRRALGLRADVASRASVEELAARVCAQLGGAHVLCNNAGVLRLGSLLEASEEDWRWLLSVNLFGSVNGVRAFVPRMRAQGGEAHIVNTASVNGLFAGYPPGVGVYAASKYAVVGFSEALRTELAPLGIGVSVVCPGDTRTRILEAGRNRPAEFGGPTPAYDRLAPVEQAMDPARVATEVVRAVRENRFWVLTHPETRPAVEARCQELLAGFDA